jgi:hypothetical protein
MPKIIHSGVEPLSSNEVEELGHHDDEYADEEASVDSTNACPKNFTLLWETGKFKTGFHPNAGKPVWHCLLGMTNQDLIIITQRRRLMSLAEGIASLASVFH